MSASLRVARMAERFGRFKRQSITCDGVVAAM